MIRSVSSLARTRAALLLGAVALAAGCASAPEAPESSAPRFGMVIHGGAGTIPRGSLSPEREAEYEAKLSEALLTGHRILEAGGSSLDAVEATINVLEDSPLFNAGKGAVFTSEGKNELDAAIMDGRTRQAGAVAGVTHVKNPIDLARAVMEESPHVMMVGAGAEAFARAQGIELVPESYFYTEARYRSLQRAKENESAPRPDTTALIPDDHKFGTVGAVALDRAGNLAAGTSTGGMTNKRWGRVGDAPIIGAGTFADNRCAGISATGHGEFFIRSVVAYDICALMLYRGLSVEEATRQVVMEKLVERGGEGGVIAMDAQGNVAMPFNSSGMYRGYVGPDGKVTVAIYRD